MSWLRDDTHVHVYPSQDPGGSDADLVTQARRGDAQAFATLYRRYLNRVYAFTATRVATREMAEDATQTIFLKALGSLHTCRDPNLFAGWLFAIARNVVIDVQRQGRVSVTSIDTAPDLADPDPSPESAAVSAEWSRELDRLRTECLPPADRDVLDLRLRGLSDQEIAVALHRSHGAIRTAQYRMVQRLRACLDRLREAVHV